MRNKTLQCNKVIQINELEEEQKTTKKKEKKRIDISPPNAGRFKRQRTPPTLYLFLSLPTPPLSPPPLPSDTYSLGLVVPNGLASLHSLSQTLSRYKTENQMLRFTNTHTHTLTAPFPSASLSFVVVVVLFVLDSSRLVYIGDAVWPNS
ncbi:hypothetical protein LZ32DRAFT_435430 [Colletotrichum eremochloae]|nr:hypothetical protein LZ32DRAFT_435430 [Colletotrichum eremochloae]